MCEKEAMDVLLNTAFTVSEKNADKVECAIRTAIQALDKRVPKQPLKCDSLDGGIKFGVCPFCGSVAFQINKFCDQCGQALEWGEDDQDGILS